MKISIEYNKEDTISAFAFSVGRLLDLIIQEKTNNLFKTNQELEAKILDFSTKTTDSNYKDYFGIKEVKEGNL